MGFFAKSMLERLRKFDAYPKTLEDFQIKTFTGGTGMLHLYLSITLVLWLDYFFAIYITSSMACESSSIELATQHV